MIRGFCSVCGRAFKVDDRFAGMTGRCKSCGANIQVPGEADEGLDGLPQAAGAGDQESEAAPPSPTAGEAAPPTSPPSSSASSRGPFPREAAPAMEAPSPAAARSPAGDLAPHDARSRYEPDHGPTAVEGGWLKESPQEPVASEEPAATPEEPEKPPEARKAPKARDVLLSSKMLTEVETAGAAGRPKLLVVACVVVGLLAVGFVVHMISLGTLGLAAAGIGLMLAVMAILRLWTGFADGLVPAILLCLCVGGGAFLRSEAPEAQIALLSGSALALTLILLGVLLPSGREYFSD